MVDCVHNVSGEQTTNAKTPSGLLLYKHYHQCRYCAQTFIRCDRVREHVMRHLNYRPYSCSFCEFRSVRGNYVAAHVRMKHPTASFTKNNYLYVRDDSLDMKLKNGYYTVSRTNDSAVKDAETTLQDHTYNVISPPRDKTSADDLHQNHDIVQLRGINLTSKNAVKITMFPKKKPGFGSSRSKKVHSCQSCSFLASSQASLMIHVSNQHSTMRCVYCDYGGRYPSEMLVHWYESHRDLPFKYRQLADGDGPGVDVDTPAAAVKTMIDEHFSSFSEFEKQCGVQVTNAASDEPAMAADSGSGLESLDDVIYCCETCPSSFSTPEALTSHQCTVNVQQATV